MKYLIILLIALASCHKVKKDPLPVVKCLLESDKLANDVVLVVEAVKKFVEDKDLNSLLSVLLVAVPDAYNEVMVCVKKNVNLEKFPKIKIPKIKIKLPKIKLPKIKIGKIIKGMKFKDLTKKLQKKFKKMIKRVPKKLLNGILNSLKDYGIDQAKKLCNDQIDGGEAICENLEMLKDEIKINIK